MDLIKPKKSMTFKRTLLSSVIALYCCNGFAADAVTDVVNDAENKSVTKKQDDIEVLEVRSVFKQNLESALFDKKSSDEISDSISAEDIGSLPALDMGEALQAVPGVQLNREGSRRESSVNLRGLPSGFVLTTANGQAIATPTRNASGNAFGPGNPFGAYDPSVFSGLKVVKSLSADMIEGGISGTIDQGLKGALSRKDSLVLQLGGRYEELADKVDGEGVISGSKHLIEDKLAINGTFAYSDQSFRRDVVRINAYDTISEQQFDQGNNSGTFAEYKAANNLPDNAIIQMPGEYRQQSETNSGNRFSFSGGIEYQATDALKLGFNTIITKRELDESRLEQLEMRLDQKTVGITPRSEYAPRDTGQVGTDGEPIYTLSGVDFNNSRYYFDNRGEGQKEEAEAYIFDAEYVIGMWKLDGALTLSSAENEWSQVLISSRINSPSGVDGSIYTGEGDIGDFNMDLTGTDTSMDWDGATWVPKTQVANTAVTNTTGANGLYMLLTGNYEKIEHESNAFEINAERDFEEGFIKSVRFGYRYADTSLDSEYAKGSPVGVDPTGILTSDAMIDPSYVSENSFFGGDAPGFVSAADGWRSFDFNSVNNALLSTIDINQISPSNDGEQPVFSPTGYITRGGRQADGLVYSSTLETNAAYLMANYEFEFGDHYLRGNLGGRYIESKTESRAPLAGQGDINDLEEGVYPDDYDHFLPTFNAAINLDEDDDLLLRFAYGQSLVRPDLRAANPSASFNYIPGLTTVSLPGVGIKPFEAESFDLSLEWYNRPGSSISFAVFQKEIENLFDSQSICDSSALSETGVDLGALTLDPDGTCRTDGNDNLSDADLVSAGDEVRLSGTVNIEDTIKVQGYELSIQQNLDFLSYPWNGFGGVFNYSKTTQDDSDEVRVPGISEDTFNVIGYYEQENYGVRLAYNYRSEYDLRTVGTSNGSGDRSVKAAGRLDASAYYNFTDSFTVSLKAYNLTDTLYEEYQNNEWQPRATNYDGRVYALSMKYKFL
ncbi:TonB-dependent receptor [Shewanella sp. UCD-KL21]|uniref:TonB-dependent receptor n=1 Tax=Shewanella sp. UCD-KL21 TaxID=1917164 RepID=UPI00097049AA|nr:TonB-dependent receptor [Shewanella sp. UCD-KL21]